MMSEAETQRLKEVEERLNQIEATLRVTGQPGSQLLIRLERAVLQAAERGDGLADTMKAGSPESIVENLAAHFQAVSKTQGGRAQKPQPKKRLVSKGAYAVQVGSKVGLSAFGLTLCILCFIGILTAALAACLLPLGGFFGFLGALLVTALGGVVCLLMKDAGGRALQKATQIKPDVPLTRANMGDLAANDSLVRASQFPSMIQEAVLVRASQEPAQAQEAVLLRPAVGEAQTSPEGQLLRATVGGQEPL